MKFTTIAAGLTCAGLAAATAEPEPWNEHYGWGKHHGMNNKWEHKGGKHYGWGHKGENHGWWGHKGHHNGHNNGQNNGHNNGHNNKGHNNKGHHNKGHHNNGGNKGGNGGNGGGMSICDKYTTALFGDNNAANQQTLLTVLVNTAVIGNYTQPNMNAVPGLLAPTTYMGEQVQLLPYFNGGLASTNTGGVCGASVNFLDGGGAAPLMNNMPANDKNSNQYTLLVHLYQYFAGLLGCSIYGKTVMPYAGSPNMASVHKFMGLDSAEVGWFIQNVGLAAASFGVSSDDVNTVAMALMNAFGYRCLPPVSIPPTAAPMPQSICQACTCPKGPNADCSYYTPAYTPVPASKVKGGDKYCLNRYHHSYHKKYNMFYSTCGGDNYGSIYMDDGYGDDSDSYDSYD